MLNITNRKVGAFDVRWAHFQGFTVLFDNPGDNCFRKRQPGIYDLANNVQCDPSLNFYEILHENLASLDIDSLTNRFLFCPLTSASYHVTLWSGLNCRNAPKVNSQYHSMVENWYLTLPNSFMNTPKEILELAESSPICTTNNWNINFRFNGLVIWNDSVLVATLRPDDDSITKLEELTTHRRQLNKQYCDRFNVSTDSDTYIPHVSLGYFANEQGGKRATEFLQEWNTLFTNALQNEILTFNNASIYGFTDMVTFFKKSL